MRLRDIELICLGIIIGITIALLIAVYFFLEIAKHIVK